MAALIWLANSDLVNATSQATFDACFDDNADGMIDQTKVDSVMTRAEQEVLSWLVDELGPPPLPGSLLTELSADNFLKYAAVEFAIAYMFDRAPEAVRQTPRDIAERLKRAETRMQRVLDARQRPPTMTTLPRNVGGLVNDGSNRLVIPNADGTTTSGDF